MDLEDKELKATRKLNGVAKDSNIEEDIKRCEKLIEPQNANWIGITNQLAIAHLIEKVKELRAMCEEYCPKTERIKELEVLEDDLKDKRVVYIDTPEFAENYIPKQKVKDKMEKLNKEIKNADTIEAIFKIKQQQILEELLEDK